MLRVFAPGSASAFQMSNGEERRLDHRRPHPGGNSPVSKSRPQQPRQPTRSSRRLPPAGADPQHGCTATGQQQQLYDTAWPTCSSAPLVLAAAIVTVLAFARWIGLGLSIAGLNESNRRGGAGKGVAIAGIVISGLMLLANIAYVIGARGGM